MTGLRLPKILGEDGELCNLLQGPAAAAVSGSGGVAARALLERIDGLPLRGSSWYTPRPAAGTIAAAGGYDYGYESTNVYWENTRRWQPDTGGCIYIDMNHLELALPEVRSAYDYVAVRHAYLRLADEARVLCNQRLRENRLVVLANNSDGLGNSWGTHTNVLISGECWQRILHEKLWQMLWLASYQVSSIVFAGQGKVGAENHREPCRFQLSQRADFVETISGPQTTHRRPLINTRDEPLAGRYELLLPGIARLHVIFYDANLQHVALLLKAGMLQIVAAMLEAEEELDPSLLLDDPLAALEAFSHDPDLQARAALIDRRRVSAVELQRSFHEAAARFVEAGGCEGIVPHAEDILRLHGEVLETLGRGEWWELAGRLDWPLKRLLLEQAIDERGLDWDSPDIKTLDHLYASIDPGEGLYHAYLHEGLLDQVASEDDIRRSFFQPPEDTRAWARAMLLRNVPPDEVSAVDWDHVTLRRRAAGQHWPSTVKLRLDCPYGYTRAALPGLFDPDRELDDIVAELQGLEDAEWSVAPGDAINGAPGLVPAGAGGGTDGTA
ncbi:MAG: proteasome accessory factor PafA2 family protein [Armatimonadetes bacterium]|nr:proteasome accessory factor PafA2 family protein [Armatimonadota bacterium]